MGSKVLLISPNRCVSPDPVFPLGLAHVNAALRTAGHETRLLDFLADPEPLREALRGFQPDFVGVSLRNIDDVAIRKQQTYFDSVVTIVETVRRARSCPVIVGGSGFSIYPAELLELSGADFGIQGDGEAEIVALVAALSRGGAWEGIPGLVFRRGPEIVSNPPRWSAVEVQLETADRPAALAGYYVRASGTLNVQTQRGCRHACVYCTYPLIEGRAHRRRPPEVVAEEMAQLQAQGAKYAFIVDGFFNSSAQHVTETCEAIIRRHLSLRWGCFLRPQALTPELMLLMKRAGLSHIEFGSDSFCDAVLEQYAKALEFEDIFRSNELAQQAEIDCCHFLLCGGPGETMDTLETSFNNSRRLAGAVVLAVVGVRVYPRTALAQRALHEGCITNDTDLLRPVYYLAPGLTEEALFERLHAFARRSSNWIVGEPVPEYENLVARLRSRGVVGPLWSYFALLQRIMPAASARFGMPADRTV